MIDPRPPLVALASSAALVGTYLALGGASYKPLEVADPCDPRPVEQLEERDGVVQRLALSALDGAACKLRVTREELALALATDESRRAFGRQHRISEDELEDAVRAGLERAVTDGRRDGTLSGIEAELLETAVKRAPLGLLLRALRSEPGKGLIDLLTNGFNPGDLGDLLP